jgi:hypothetical protein
VNGFAAEREDPGDISVGRFRRTAADAERLAGTIGDAESVEVTT